jgi:hypothetical protein
MNPKRFWQWQLAGLGLALGTLSGCQTWVGGMTLPSGRYLQHPPQYIPQSPAFPLSRELASQEATALVGGPGAPPLLGGTSSGPLPPPVPPPPGAVAPAPAAVVPAPVAPPR